MEVETRPDAKIVTFGYDGAGRLDAIVADGGDRVFDYWSTGQLRSFSEAHGGTTEFTWDGPLLVGATRTGTFDAAVTWAYDEDLSLASETVVDASTVVYDYDDDDLLVGVGVQTIGRHAVTGGVTGTTLAEVTSAVGWSTFAELASLSYAHDASTLYDAVYERDELGRIDTKTETIGGVTTEDVYEYDSAGRLWRVTRDGNELFEALYDGNGNRLELETPAGTRVAVYDDQDRLLEENDLDDLHLEYAYNEAGELASRTDTSTNEVTTYAYHETGGLLQVEESSGAEITYRIDGAGRRIGKRVDGEVVRGWVYGAQLGPVAELDEFGAIRSRFVYGTRGHVPDFMERDGVTYRLVTDHLGSVRLVVDVDTGVIAQRIDYDPWGVVLADTAAGFQPFGYAGGLYDPDTGLVRFGARDYDAAAGRWTTKDPIGFGGGDANLYAYVAGDPINGIDPTGLWWDNSTQFVTDITDFSAGFGDVLSFGTTKILRTALGYDDVVNSCSGAYQTGVIVGVAHGVLSLGAGQLASRGMTVQFIPWYRGAKGVGVNVYKNWTRWLGLDAHMVHLNGRRWFLPHFHYGNTNKLQKLHRPWQKP